MHTVRPERARTCMMMMWGRIPRRNCARLVYAHHEPPASDHTIERADAGAFACAALVASLWTTYSSLGGSTA